MELTPPTFGASTIQDHMYQDQVSTVAVDTPEFALSRGEILKFDAKRLLFEGANGDHMPIGSQNGVLLALSLRDDDGHHTTGSAVLVGPGIAICALHVLTDRGFFEKLSNGGATAVAQAPLPDGMLLWTVHRVTAVFDSDLAMLSMSLNSAIPASRRFDVASITTRMPAVGDVLTVTGLSAIREIEEIARATHIKMITGCAHGPVIDLYPNGRDRSLAGPCLAVECDARGGMSGGPVFLTAEATSWAWCRRQSRGTP